MSEVITGITGNIPSTKRLVESLDMLDAQSRERKGGSIDLSPWNLLLQLVSISEKETYSWGDTLAHRDVHRATTAFTTLVFNSFTPDQRAIIEERFMSVFFTHTEVSLTPTQVEMLGSITGRLGIKIDPERTDYSLPIR